MLSRRDWVNVFPARVLAVARCRLALRRREPAHVTAAMSAPQVTTAIVCAGVMPAGVVARRVTAAPGEGALRYGDKSQSHDASCNFHNGALFCSTPGRTMGFAASSRLACPACCRRKRRHPGNGSQRKRARGRSVTKHTSQVRRPRCRRSSGIGLDPVLAVGN
jgi:hypothetical protein